MNRRKVILLRRTVSLLMSIVMLLAVMTTQAFAEEKGSSELSFAVVSGISYVSSENRGGYNDAFLLDAKANGYQYEQIDSILASTFDSLKKKVENEDLKYIIVNGPLTYNGEYSNHAAVAEMLRKLETETGVNVIVNFAGSDVNSASASSFATGKRTYVTPATATQLKTLYADLGYDLADSVYNKYDQSNAGLSYAVNLDGGYRLVVIDATYFEYAKNHTSVSGKISTNLQKWIKDECTYASFAGYTAIAVCAWSITGNSILGNSGYLTDADAFANFLADSGIHYIFTSGSNKNDISAVISDNGNLVYDVQSASIVSFPNTYRVCTFNGEKASFSLVDADETMNIVSRSGAEYAKPYRETASLKIQYADFDLARYFSDIIKNYVSSILIPGVKANGTLEGFVQSQYGISLKDYINDIIGGGLNIMDTIIIFDASNIMNMLEDVFQQMQSVFLQDENKLANLCYARIKTLLNAEISSESCTAFADTYGFGSDEHGGTVGEFILSLIVYSKYGNEDATEDAFVKDVTDNFRTGELFEFVTDMVGEVIIRDLLFEDILSQIEMKPQYLLFLDDTQDSLGFYLQIAFKAYIALHGESASITGAVKSVLKDGFFEEYGKTIDDVIDNIIDDYYSEDDCQLIGSQLATIIESYYADEDPVFKGDHNVEYDGNKNAVSFATRENFRLPTMITITPGNDTCTEAYVTWYTKSTVTGTDIEIYNDKNSTFYGKHFIGVDGVKTVVATEDIERKSVALDLGFVTFGERTDSYKQHIMKITGLEPGCTYFFRVGDSTKGRWSETATVTTAADSETVSFIHVSDSMGKTDEDFALFENILGCANYLYPDNDFILHTGNYVENNSDINQWQRMLDGISDKLLSSYIVATAGSTDTVDSVKQNFAVGALLSDVPRTGVYYSFDYNFIHVAVLDSNCVNEDGTLKEEQVKWFKKDMAASTARWKFVAIHDPVYTNSEFAHSETYEAYMNQLTDLMEQYDVDILFSGSEGVYYRTDGMKNNEVSDTPKVAFPHQINSNVYYKTIPTPSGTVYSSVGSAGVLGTQRHQIYNTSGIFPSSGQAINPENPMFTAIEIMGDTIYLTTYTVKGNRASKVDSVSIRKDATDLGDVDFDGKVTAIDARLILRSAALLQILTKAQYAVADVNGDGKVDASDARLALRMAAGLE